MHEPGGGKKSDKGVMTKEPVVKNQCAPQMLTLSPSIVIEK
jgi:hypothetical protein